MTITYRPYENKYLAGCSNLIKTTWSFEKGLKNPKNANSLYRYFVEDCLDWSDYRLLLVNESDVVVGILFASLKQNKAWLSYLFQIKTISKIIWHILKGDLGSRRAAFKTLGEMRQEDKMGGRYADDYDATVNLFILSPSVRGQGYGRQLMDKFIGQCRQSEVQDLFLWTTTECSYSFYESYGFSVRDRYPLDVSSVDGQVLEEGIIYEGILKEL